MTIDTRTLPRDVDAAIVARLSTFTEAAALTHFWTMLHHGAPVLPLLLEFSYVVITRPSTWDVAEVRRAHQEHVRAHTIGNTSTACCGCGGDRQPRFLHHVIAIQHGGSNTARNLVSLCFACHQFVHPWLKDTPAPPPARVDGFERIGDLRRRIVRLEGEEDDRNGDE